MRKIFKIINGEFKKNKKILVFIAILLTIGLISGSLFITIINSSDKKLVLETISNYFNKVKTTEIDYLYSLGTSITSNLLYVLFIWLLGISVIGLSISSIICEYKLGGAALSLSYVFPHHILNIITLAFVTMYALKVSLSLVKLITSKNQINLKLIIRRYIGVLIITVLLCVISSLIEAFVTPHFIKLFSFLIK